MSTAIHGRRPLPRRGPWCTLRRWTRAKTRVHLLGRASSVSYEGRSANSGLLFFHEAIPTLAIAECTDSGDWAYARFTQCAMGNPGAPAAFRLTDFADHHGNRLAHIVPSQGFRTIYEFLANCEGGAIERHFPAWANLWASYSAADAKNLSPSSPCPRRPRAASEALVIYPASDAAESTPRGRDAADAARRAAYRGSS
jgi:hypothetical protein